MAIHDFPPSPDEVRLYAVWLILTVCAKADSLRQYLSALRVYAARRGHWVPSPTEYGPLLAVVKGAARVFAAPTRRSRPVSPEILTNLLLSLPPPGATLVQLVSLQTLKDTALILFLTMLRGSNLFPANHAAIDPLRQLTWEKIRRVHDGVVISIILSKTVQYRERIHEIHLAASPGSLFCPVAALDRLLAARGGAALPTDLVLQLPAADGTWAPLMKYQFVHWFRGRLAEMGEDPSAYSVHGFRHGSIQHAILHQGNMTLIRLHSNHMSDAIMCYSHVDPAKRRAVSAAMVSALDDHVRQFRWPAAGLAA